MSGPLCPNDPPCGHAWHDIYDPGDPYPACCTEGCRCGQPGDAVLTRHADGAVTVDRADPVIRVAQELLDEAEPWAWNPGSEVLTLDTAGRYRYQYLRPDPRDGRVLIFGRIRS